MHLSVARREACVTGQSSGMLVAGMSSGELLVPETPTLHLVDGRLSIGNIPVLFSYFS